ncbi:M55 family metallopeptidase [Brevibacillus humidisoli]|uniref:M55 family metallopeptidase n=1 Tax=Brevibacillus humidisoli TaxID=2895522 RepID=UPI001E586A3A|nr:M55 family metallopeptidase [Brevibacillus humidisoli]UFJ42389.1 M55 family metallopeptidase [Brevibacillus humidisoli]
MKLFISADMEGISGIVDPSYINPDNGKNYERGRQWMTDDVNAVVEAALQCGAEEIVVSDSHYHMTNILLEKLHPKAKLIAGSPRDFSMMQGLDGSFDAAFFIGYHTRQGVPGVLSHTMSGVIKNMYINDVVVGEFGFNAIYAGLMGVPVCMVSGDDLIAEEASELIPGITTAVVKKAVTRTSALCLPLAESREVLKQQVKLALQNKDQVAPLTTATPLELTIEFSHAGQAEMAAIVPFTRYQAERTAVSLTADNPHDLYRGMRAMLNLAGTAEFF